MATGGSRVLRPLCAPRRARGPFSMGGLRLAGVKLRDLGVTVRTYPPIEKGPKGCRGLQVTMATALETGRDGKARSAAARCRNAPLGWPSAQRNHPISGDCGNYGDLKPPTGLGVVLERR